MVVIGFDLGAYGPDKNGVDGHMGSLTTKALKEFQKVAGLKPNGKMDEQTMTALELVVEAGLKKVDIKEIGGNLGYYADPISKAEKLLFIKYGASYSGQYSGSTTVSGNPGKIDCSELISYSYGTPLYRTWEFNKNSKFKKVNAPQRDDVIIDLAFDKNGKFIEGHAMLYTGEGGNRAVLHSSGSKGVAYTSDYIQNYYKKKYPITTRTYYRLIRE